MSQRYEGKVPGVNSRRLTVGSDLPQQNRLPFSLSFLSFRFCLSWFCYLCPLMKSPKEEELCVFLIIQPDGPRGSEKNCFPFRQSFQCWECHQKDGPQMLLRRLKVIFILIWGSAANLKHREDSHVCLVNHRVNRKLFTYLSSWPVLSFWSLYMLIYFGVPTRR